MTKFFWFERFPQNTKNLDELSNKLEENGFYGLLLPYGPGSSDHFTKISRIIKPERKLKYMVAVRPYTISPQFLYSICHSINSICNDRIIINFVAGHQPSEQEKLVGGIVGDINDSSFIEDRKEYLLKHVDIFYNFIKDKKYKPEIAITGNSQKILDAVEKFSDYSIVAFDHQKKNYENLNKITKKRIVSIVPVIRKFENNDFVPDEFIQDIFHCTKESLDDLIKNLKIQGIDNIMFRCANNDPEKESIFNYVRNFNV